MPTQIAELIPKLPEPVRALPRSAIWTYGRLTSSLRPLPTALIIGAQKARDDGALRLAAAASRRRRAVLEGGQLLRPPVREGRALVPGQLSQGARARPSSPRRAPGTSSIRSRPSGRGRSSRTRASSRSSASRSRARTRTTSTRSRSGASRSRSRRRSTPRTSGCRASSTGCWPIPAYFSHAWWNYTYLARGLLRRAARALAGGLSGGAAADHPERGPRSAAG